MAMFGRGGEGSLVERINIYMIKFWTSLGRYYTTCLLQLSRVVYRQFIHQQCKEVARHGQTAGGPLRAFLLVARCRDLLTHNEEPSYRW